MVHSAPLSPTQKHKNLFKPFVIAEIILCPYLIDAIDIMKLLLYHPLAKYNCLVIYELKGYYM